MASLAAFAVIAALSFDPKPFVGGDNATYVLLSKAVAHGQGMRETWVPGNPPHLLYPFGFPLLLAPISLLELAYPWYKTILFLCGLAGVLLWWNVKTVSKSRGGIVVAALLLAINPFYIEYTHWILSELPYLAFSLLTVILLQKWEKSQNQAYLAAYILCAVFTYHVRSAGLALIAGLTFYLAAKKRTKEAVASLTACAVLSLPWFLRNQYLGGGGNYLGWLLVKNPYMLEQGRVTFGEMAQRIWSNAILYSVDIIPRALFPAIGVEKASLPTIVPILLLTGPTMLALLYRLVYKKGIFDAYVTLSLAIVIVWPTSWSDIRLIIPLLPFLLFYLIRGYGWTIDHLFKRGGWWIKAFLLILLAAGSIGPSTARINTNLGMLSAYFKGDRLAGYEPQWRGFFQAAEWVKGNTAEGSIVVSRKPQLFYLASGRQSFCYPFTANTDSVRGRLDRADYVMVEPVSGTVQRYLIPAVEPYMGAKYSVIHAVGNPPTYVLKVNKENVDAR